MFKKTFCSLLLTYQVFAMDLPEDELTQKSSSMTVQGPFSSVPSDLLVQFSSFLDLKSCFSYLATCQKVKAHEPSILLLQVPNMYAHRGLDHGEVFFSFAHPQWTPDQLPTEVALTLHKWFFVGRKLKNAASEACPVF